MSNAGYGENANAENEAREGYTQVKNVHTGRVAGVPKGATAYVKDWIADHYPTLLIKVSGSSGSRPPLAVDLIKEIETSTDVKRLEDLASEDARKTVREAAEFRIMELDE